jgi:hypothetical protein
MLIPAIHLVVCSHILRIDRVDVVLFLILGTPLLVMVNSTFI